MPCFLDLLTLFFLFQYMLHHGAGYTRLHLTDGVLGDRVLVFPYGYELVYFFDAGLFFYFCSLPSYGEVILPSDYMFTSPQSTQISLKGTLAGHPDVVSPV